MPPFTAPLQTHLSDTARSVRLTLPKPQKSRTALRFKARQARAAAALANMAKFPAGRRRPRPGDLGRYRADPGRPRSRPAGGLGAKWGEQQPRPPGDQQNTAAGLPRPRRNPRTAATAPVRQPSSGRASQPQAALSPAPVPGPPPPPHRSSGSPHLRRGQGRAGCAGHRGRQNRRFQVRRRCPSAKPQTRAVRRRGEAVPPPCCPAALSCGRCWAWHTQGAWGFRAASLAAGRCAGRGCCCLAVLGRTVPHPLVGGRPGNRAETLGSE